MSFEQPPNEQPGGQSHRERERSSRWASGTTWGAVVLILLGLVFLGNELGLFGALGDIFNVRFNWWALFLLIPIISIGGKLVANMQASGGRIDQRVRNNLVGLLVMIIVFGTLAFSLDWGKIWPFFLIAAGIGALLNAIAGD